MRMRFVIIIMIFFGLSGCKVLQCAGDQNSISLYERNLKVVRNAQLKSEGISVDDFLNAVVFLSNVTGVISQVNLGNMPGYASIEAYKDDVAAWEQWLKKNKCKLNKHYVDSAMQVHKYRK